MFYRLCILLVLISSTQLAFGGSRSKRQSNSIGVSGSVSINGSLGSGGSKESEESDLSPSPSPSPILPSILNSLKLLGEFSTARANQRVIEAIHLLAGILQNSSKTLSDDINESIQLALSQVTLSVSTGTSTLNSLQGFLNSFSQYINGSLNNSTLKSTLENSISRLNGFIQSSSGRGLDAFLKVVTVPAETYREAMNRLSNQLKNGLTALIENRSQYPYSVFSSATSILAQLNTGALNSTLQNILVTNPALLNDQNNVVLPFTALIKYLEGMGSTSIQKSASLISSQIFTILNAFGNLVFSLFGFNPNANITVGAGLGSSGTNNLGGSVGGSGNLFSLFG